jgi:hypothetical protein
MPLGGTGLRIKTNERKRFESGNQAPGRQVFAMRLKFLPTSADKGSSLCDTSIDSLTFAVLIEKLLIPPIVPVANAAGSDATLMLDAGATRIEIAARRLSEISDGGKRCINLSFRLEKG